MAHSGGRLTRLALAALGLALLGWALSADDRWAERHLLVRYCFTSLAGQAAAHGLRWSAALAGVVCVGWSAPLWARRTGRAALRPGAGAVAGVALAIVAALGVTEMYLRLRFPRLPFEDPGITGAQGGAPMYRLDRRLGWIHVPGRTTWADQGGRRVAYAIDSAGDRVLSAEEEPDRALPTVLFTGESIAFGWGLRYQETIPFLVGRELHLQAVNLAVGAYGNDQAHLRLTDELPRYARPVAVVTLFLTDQIRRNVNTWRPRLVLRPEGALELVPPAGGPRVARLIQELPLHGGEPLAVTAAILRATADAARARGARPLFVVTNYGPACLPDEPGEESWVVQQLFVRQGLPFVRVDLHPEDLMPGGSDLHPGPGGA